MPQTIRIQISPSLAKKNEGGKTASSRFFRASREKHLIFPEYSLPIKSEPEEEPRLWVGIIFKKANQSERLIFNTDDATFNKAPNQIPVF